MRKALVALIVFVPLVAFASGEGESPQASGVVAEVMLTSLPRDGQSDYNLSDYEQLTGTVIGSYNQSPILDARVASGELPPVADRMPDEPLVSVPFREIGKYGGTITLPGVGKNNWFPAWQIVKEFTLNRDVRWYNNHQPGIAKSATLSDDFRTLTLQFREGHKWSDGAPFTADDVTFWWDSFMLNETLHPTVSAKFIFGGEPMQVEKVDDTTVRMTFAIPNANAIWLFTQVQGYGAQNQAFMPRHYLEQFHVDFNGNATALAKEAGHEDWHQLFAERSSAGVTNPELPTLYGWTVTQELTDGLILDRNPYFHRIDPVGNQLPYIDQVRAIFYGDPQTLKLRTIAGDFDFVSFGIVSSDLPLLLANAESANYDAFMVPSVYPAENPMYINQNRPEGEEKGDLFRDKRFRQALSLAIDRDEVNEVVHRGVGTPVQSTVFYDNSFYDPKWAEAYADFDPERANAMLDEIGLDKRDGDGYRLLPSGDKLTLFMEMPVEYPGNVETGELVKEYWEDVGVRVDMTTIGFGNMVPKLFSGDYDVSAWPVDGSEEVGWRFPGAFNGPKATLRTHFTAPLWHTWFETGGAQGIEPPPEQKRILELVNRTHLMSDEELQVAGTEIMEWWSENFWMIGIVGYSKLPFIARRTLGNVERDTLNAPVLIGTSKLIRPETLYFKE